MISNLEDEGSASAAASSRVKFRPILGTEFWGGVNPPPPGKHLDFELRSIVQPVTQGSGVEASLFGRLKSVSVRNIQSPPWQKCFHADRTVTADLDSKIPTCVILTSLQIKKKKK